MTFSYMRFTTLDEEPPENWYKVGTPIWIGAHPVGGENGWWSILCQRITDGTSRADKSKAAKEGRARCVHRTKGTREGDPS